MRVSNDSADELLLDPLRASDQQPDRLNCEADNPGDALDDEATQANTE